MYTNIIVLVLFSFIQFIYDIIEYPCTSYNGIFLLFLHHVLSGYIYLGGILFNPLYHALFLLVLHIHWVHNDNKCFFTEITNNICYPKYKGYKVFNDFLNQYNNYGYLHISGYYVIFILLSIDIFMLKI